MSARQTVEFGMRRRSRITLSVSGSLNFLYERSTNCGTPAVTVTAHFHESGMTP